MQLSRHSAFLQITLIFGLLLISVPLHSQLKGRVTDAQSGQPLAFVHVLVKDTRIGAMTDIDGFFQINLPEESVYLQLSYVGYFSKMYEVSNRQAMQQVRMHPRPFQLEEVVVVAGENPAHRIIRNAINNRNINDPERLRSFTYKSYNKFLATLDRDFYLERWQMTGDSSHFRTADWLDQRHIFIMESVTERRFRSPNLDNETVVANRVSGLRNPMFTLLATELQPFSFYGSTITLLDNEYISPLNRTAFARYSYHLEDTLFQGNDSVFVISYQPREGTNFDGLKGLLYINSNMWAIQNVIAQPSRAIQGRFHFRIQQKYSQIDGRYWFPVQLNTDIDFFNPDAADPTSMAPIRMFGRSYLEEIIINPELRRRDFSSFAVDFSPDANIINDEFWQDFRPESLDRREQNTYQFMDSVGHANNFDRIFNSVEPLLFGEIPLGQLSIPLNSIYRFNEFERHRIGLGLKTNNRFSRRIALGGHWAWGSGDRREKYGYFGEVVLLRRNDLRLGGSYSFDVSERGGSNLVEKSFLLSPNLIRNFYIDKKDYTQRATAYLSFLSLRNFLITELSVSRGKTFWTDMYYFIPQGHDEGTRSYRFSEATMRMRLAWGETLMNTPTRVIRLPSNYPVFYLNLTRGFDNIDRGELDYLRLEARADISYSVPLLGRQNWVVEGGWTDQAELPWPLLFSAKAGNREFYLASPFSFGTMAMNEFAANSYVSVFFQHNFENLLFRRPRYEPELVIITNAGLGFFDAPQNHLFMPGRDWSKGFFESGIAINKIFPQHWVRRVVFGMSPGIEILYRYGPYAFPQNRDNFTIKLNMITSF